MRKVALLAAVCLVAVACNNENTVPKHTATEEAAIQKVNAMTPEQRIARIQNSPMLPQGAKDAMTKRIRDKYGLK